MGYLRRFKSNFLRPMMVLTLISGLFFTTSCGTTDGKNPQFEGVQGPVLTLIDDNLLITIVLENVILDGGLRVPIPKYEHSYIEVGPDFDTGGTLIAASISLQDVFNDKLQMLDPQTLPGGRAIPGVMGGRLPATAFQILDYGLDNFAFYLGPKMFGTFVPIKFNLPNVMATYRFYVEGKRIGNISLVGEDDNGEHSGLFLLLDLDSVTIQKLKTYAQRYE